MRAFVLRAHGGIDEYDLVEDWPEPAAGPGEALVEVKAVGLNYLDIFVRRGMPGLPVRMPRIPGGDIAGIVRDVGEGAPRALVGRRVLVDPMLERSGVLGEHADGGLCEYIAFAADNMIPLPDAVSFEQAAALPVAYGTAHRMMLARARVRAGELCLILGASGGVGTCCVQIAKAEGAQVIACASSPDKLEKLRALGADHLVNYAEEDFSRRAWEISGKKGVDLIVNYTGGDTWRASLRTVRQDGRIVCCGATAGFEPQTDLRYLWRREAHIIGANGWTRDDLDRLVAKVADRSIEPVIDRVAPMDQAWEAMRALEARETFGKVIVRP